MREESLLTPVIAEQRNIAFIYTTITTHPTYFGPKNVLLFPPPPTNVLKNIPKQTGIRNQKGVPLVTITLEGWIKRRAAAKCHGSRMTKGTPNTPYLNKNDNKDTPLSHEKRFSKTI